MRLPGGQDLAVALIAAGALGWLVRRAWHRRARGAACEDCPGCAPAAAEAGRSPARGAPRPAGPQGLVQIEGERRR